MPPKRKALSETTPNKRQTRASKKAAEQSPTAAKAQDSTPKSSNSAKPPKKGAKKPPAKSKDKEETSSKKSDGGTSFPKPSYQMLQWPNIGEFIDDKDQDMPKDGELLDSWCDRVSDLGFPVSELGATGLEKLSDEAEKRDQDSRDLHIYSDWTGWGVSEVMCNMMKDFDKDLSKKTTSPHNLWAYVEAFTCFITTEDFYMTFWMGNEDGPGVGEIINMIGVMVLTSLQKLSEHDLLKPESDAKNIPIICLLLLDFLNGVAADFDCKWACEVVRLCDEAGIELQKHVRKQVSVTEKDIEELREEYAEKKEASECDQGEDGEGNGYKAFARKEDWKPQDDWNTQAEYGDERLWYRWDWKTEFKEFKKNHPGGNKFDLTKKSKMFLKEHSLLD